MIELAADCSSCRGLCCRALPFTRSADFAIDKPAGVSCPNLAANFRCQIHAELLPRGFGGCVSFDCFGAGQRVSRLAGPDEARFAALAKLWPLHELLGYLAEVQHRDLAGSRAVTLQAELESSCRALLPELLLLDVAGWRARVDEVLTAAGEQLRAGYPRGKAWRGRDLAGRRVEGDLRGANLRGALLIGANLSGLDLTDAEVLGADLRGARLEQAELSRALFLNQAQVNAARGDADTSLPEHLHRPVHWH